MRKGLYFAGSCLVAAFYGGSLQYVVLAQDQDKPAVAPLPRTINLTQEQRYIIKENVKDLPLPRAPSSAPETIGDIVPEDIKLYSLPPPSSSAVVGRSLVDHVCDPAVVRANQNDSVIAFLDEKQMGSGLRHLVHRQRAGHAGFAGHPRLTFAAQVRLFCFSAALI